MIVKFEPASEDRRIWRVLVPEEDDISRPIAVDFTEVPEETRRVLGDGGYFEAEPDAGGWRLILDEGIGG